MKYTTGQRVCHLRGFAGTVTRDSEDYGVVRVLWDGAEHERQELPECVKPFEAISAPVSSLRNAWAERSAR